MGEAVDFEGANITLIGNGGNIKSIPAHRDAPTGQLITCWKLSTEELAEIAETGHVWLSLLTHESPPPALVSGEALVEVHGQPAKPKD